jgi:hypothetical protein
VLNVLIAAVMLLVGSVKAFGFAPQEMVDGMTGYGLADYMVLIGVGEIVTALLLLIPWTSPLGTLATSGFWGGVICIHMSKGEPFLPACAFLAVTWLGSYLRGSVPLLWLK